MIRSKILFLLFLNLTLSPILAQDDPKSFPSRALIIKLGGNMDFGMADMGRRFPSFAGLTSDFYYKTPKKFTFGISYTPFAGNKVTIDSLYGGITGPSYFIFDKNGYPAVIRYFMRGFALQGTIGKLLPIKEDWPHSHIEFRLGAGFIQHRIKAKFDVGRVPQLEGDYRDGYDRLCNGMLLSQAVNFHYLNTESVSFFAGISFSEGFTRNRRNWDYSTMRSDNNLRKDMIFGVQAGVLIPIVLKNRMSTDYYN